MNVEYRKRFLKELARVPSSIRFKIENFAFSELPKYDSTFGVGKIEQMRGYSTFFKVRFGSYRVGLKLENDTVIFERVLHRKDIYRYFP